MVFRADPLEKKAMYYTIKEGSFRLPSNADDPEAIRREYTNPKTKEDGVSYERGFKALYGIITDVSFRENTLKDGTNLRSININIGDNEDGVAQIISIPQDSRFATDLLKRLPSVDFSKEVRLMPYDFEKDGPRQVGISIAYKNPDTEEFTVKVGNDYFTKVEEKDGKKVYTNLHGFPEPTDEDSSDWPFYFKKVEKFLIQYTKEHVLPRIGTNETRSTTSTPKATGDRNESEKIDDAFDAAFPDPKDAPPF